ncbi:MAG: hypothetical protein Q9188_004498 [Gyalolechia gomerana]
MATMKTESQDTWMGQSLKVEKDMITSMQIGHVPLQLRRLSRVLALNLQAWIYTVQLFAKHQQIETQSIPSIVRPEVPMARPIPTNFLSKSEKEVKAIMERSSTTSSKPTEAAILADILGLHRGIIDLKHWSQSPTTLWYEYCSAGDLQDLVDAYTSRRLRIPEAFIWHAYVQLADAFAYIHTGYDRLAHSDRPPRGFQPIVHRDVKPPNVFLRPNGDNRYPDLVLADFGCATTKMRSGDTYQIGTLMYQPPELPIHSPQGDVWSLGACIHVMATGSPPIKAFPKGWQGKPSGWYEEPSARVVANLEKFGYSRQLDDAMYAVMRSDPSKRLTGKELVKRVRRGYEEWGGKSVALGKWALKG